MYIYLSDGSKQKEKMIGQKNNRIEEHRINFYFHYFNLLIAITT